MNTLVSMCKTMVEKTVIIVPSVSQSGLIHLGLQKLYDHSCRTPRENCKLSYIQSYNICADKGVSKNILCMKLKQEPVEADD